MGSRNLKVNLKLEIPGAIGVQEISGNVVNNDLYVDEVFVIDKLGESKLVSEDGTLTYIGSASPLGTGYDHIWLEVLSGSLDISLVADNWHTIPDYFVIHGSGINYFAIRATPGEDEVEAEFHLIGAKDVSD